MEKKKKFSSCFNNIIPTLTLPLTLRCLFSFSDVEHSRSGQWSYLPLPAPAVFSGRKAQYLRREFFFSPLRPEHFYQVKSWISSFATRIFYHQNISDFTTRITFFVLVPALRVLRQTYLPASFGSGPKPGRHQAPNRLKSQSEISCHFLPILAFSTSNTVLHSVVASL